MEKSLIEFWCRLGWIGSMGRPKFYFADYFGDYASLTCSDPDIYLEYWECDSPTFENVCHIYEYWLFLILILVR